MSVPPPRSTKRAIVPPPRTYASYVPHSLSAHTAAAYTPPRTYAAYPTTAHSYAAYPTTARSYAPPYRPSSSTAGAYPVYSTAHSFHAEEEDDDDDEDERRALAYRPLPAVRSFVPPRTHAGFPRPVYRGY